MYRLVWILIKSFLKVSTGFKVIGQENQVREGSVVIIANHVSNWDPLVLGAALNRKVHYMAKEELFRNPFLGWLIRNLGAFPVKRGKTAKGAIQASLKILKRGDMIGLFPEGTRSRSGEVLKPNLGAVMLAVKTESPILPVALVGTKEFKKVKAIICDPVYLDEYFGKKIDKEKLEELSLEIMNQIKEKVKSA